MLPILMLVVYSFNAGTSIANWEGFSLRWFETAWNNSQVIEASLALAADRRIGGRLRNDRRDHGGARHDAHRRPIAA